MAFVSDIFCFYTWSTVFWVLKIVKRDVSAGKAINHLYILHVKEQQK